MAPTTETPTPDTSADAGVRGIHHVTAIATDPQRNVDFYTGVLGLRLVKRSVNMDDPGTHHFYYGDEGGRPGTILTFFPWPLAARGSRGAGQATVTAFAVPEGSLGWWRERLAAHGVPHDDPSRRFDEEALAFLDPDGLRLELVADAGAAARASWAGGPVPDLKRWQHAVLPWEGAEIRIVRTEETGEEGYDLWVPTERLGALWDRLREAGARPVGRDAWDILRVEAGVVRYGADVDASTLLLEAPLADAYSLNKGCYLGQEVVARITYRGHVNRKIVGFRFGDASVPARGAPVLVEGKEVGRITSAVRSPALGVALALGFLRREHFEPGTRVEVRHGDESLAAEVAPLPFYRRSGP